MDIGQTAGTFKGNGGISIAISINSSSSKK